jgi:hypothetical protein
MRISIFTSSLCFVMASACSDTSAPDDQTPPRGRTALDAWLSDGMYRSWASEPAVHEARSPSPHGFNRIFSNDAIANNASATGAWPKGAAAVKEIYASASATAPIGYAVYLKLATDTASGANWYWYERTPEGVVADGSGAGGPAKDICVACHAGAGTDVTHTPTPGGRDEVYTPVHR